MLNFDIDTTSPIIWLTSTHDKLSNSSTLNALNKTMSLGKYLSGELYNETISIVDLTAEEFNFRSIDADAYKGFKNRC